MDDNGHNFVSCHFRQYRSARTIRHACACREPRLEFRDVSAGRRCFACDRSASARVRVHICTLSLLSRLKRAGFSLLGNARKICYSCSIFLGYKTRHSRQGGLIGKVGIDGAATVDISSINKVSAEIRVLPNLVATGSIWILKLSLLCVEILFSRVTRILMHNSVGI